MYEIEIETEEKKEQQVEPKGVNQKELQIVKMLRVSQILKRDAHFETRSCDQNQNDRKQANFVI